MYFQARNRLVFEEFAQFICSLRALSKEETGPGPQPFSASGRQPGVDAFIRALPYELTGAQKRVWGEILADMQKDVSMSRLVQGDVGSGKTVIALLALLTAALNGFQGALMAPTEVLAKQHYESVTALLARAPHPRPDRAPHRLHDREGEAGRPTSRMEDGTAQIIIGTHALIQEKAGLSQIWPWWSRTSSTGSA